MENTEYKVNTAERLYLSGFDLTLLADCAGELTMPDYYPEIRRIVSVTAEAFPDSKYLSDAGLEVGGTVAFNVLYIGDDGALSAVPYVTEYSSVAPLGRDAGYSASDISLESFAESATCRPLGPRTLSLKARVRSRVIADRGVDNRLTVECADGSSPSSRVRRSLENLTEKVQTVRRSIFSATGNAFAEETVGEGVKPILCRGALAVHNVTAGRDSVTVKGVAEVTCLAMTAEGIYRTYVMRLPFEERVCADGTLPGDRACAVGRSAAVNVTVQGAVMRGEAEYDIDVYTARPLEVTVTKDAQSTVCPVEVIGEEMGVLSLVCMSGTVSSVSGEGKRSSAAKDGDRIIGSFAKAHIDRLEAVEGGVRLSGSCTFSALIVSGGDCVCEEFSIPVRAELPAEGGAVLSDCKKQISAVALSCDCRLEGERIHGKCDIQLSVNAVRETRCAPASKIVVGAEAPESDEGAVVRICYPEKGKRIWDIAKESAFSVSACERANAVSRHDLSDGTPLIIA